MKKTLLLLLALAPMALGADMTGRFAAGTKYEAPADHAPANVSRMFARAVPHSGAVDLPATGTSGMIIWTIAPSKVSTRLRTPSGAILQPNDRGSIERGLRRFQEGGDEVVHVMNAMAARYQLDVDATEGVTVVAAEPESSLTLSTWAAPLSRQPGEPVTLYAELRDGEKPITGARVTALLKGKSVELTDRGDGTYTATITDLPDDAPGTWQVRFDAEGTTPRGTPFARTGLGELIAERGLARLGRVRTEIIENALRVTAAADVNIEGNYRLDVIVSDRDGNAIAWAEGARRLTTGATTVDVDVPLDLLGGASLDGLSFDVRLLGLDPMGVAGRVIVKRRGGR